MRLAIILLVMVAMSAAHAQQPASPSQLAIQIDNAVGVMAQRAEFAEQQVAALQKQIEDLKTKCGDPCK